MNEDFGKIGFLCSKRIKSLFREKEGMGEPAEITVLSSSILEPLGWPIFSDLDLEIEDYKWTILYEQEYLKSNRRNDYIAWKKRQK